MWNKTSPLYLEVVMQSITLGLGYGKKKLLKNSSEPDVAHPVLGQIGCLVHWLWGCGLVRGRGSGARYTHMDGGGGGSARGRQNPLSEAGGVAAAAQ